MIIDPIRKVDEWNFGRTVFFNVTLAQLAIDLLLLGHQQIAIIHIGPHFEFANSAVKHFETPLNKGSSQ